MPERLTPIEVARKILHTESDVQTIVDKMVATDYSLMDVFFAMKHFGYDAMYTRDEDLKITTIVISDKPIVHMLTDVGGFAFDALRDSQAYPQQVALADLRDSIHYLQVNWDSVEFPSGNCFSRHED